MKKRKNTPKALMPLLTLLLSIAISTLAHAQGIVWAKKAGGTGTVQSNAISIDGAGNTYIAGSFQGTATFGSGESNETLLTSSGDQDVFVAKYNSLGALQWAKRAGGSNSDAATGIVVDSGGNSFVAGSFGTSATFGPGEAGQKILSSAGLQDIFIAKYDTNGALVWAKRAGGTDNDLALAITQDASGNSYLTGRFSGTATFGPGEINETPLTSAGSSSADIFVAMFDGSGTLLRVRRDGGTGFDQSNSIAVDASGATYVTGVFNGTATFGLGELTETTLVDSGNGDIFIAKYNAAGGLLWVKAAGGSGITADQGYGIALDGSGSIYVTGEFFSFATFGSGEPNQTILTSSGSSDIFIAKFNSSGLLQWVKGVGGLSTDRGLAIDVDSSGTIYVSGSFRGTVVFGQGETKQTSLTAVGTGDAFHAKYNSNGTLVWARRSGGAGGAAVGAGITFDNNGQVYLTGYFSGNAILGGGQISRWNFTATTGTDLFIAKYQVNPTQSLQWDYDGDHKADVGIYRDGTWYILRSSNGTMKNDIWGTAAWIPIPGDYDGDGITDIAVYHSSGLWSIVRSSDSGNTLIGWSGAAGDIPVPADYDGDGKTDFAIYNPTTAIWSVICSSDGRVVNMVWGGPSWMPVLGDYDGDGITDVAVYDASGLWSIVRSSDGGNTLFGWSGDPGDITVQADYDGDGKTDFAIYNPNTAWWSIIRSSDTGLSARTWGGPAWEPVAADYDGDGKADIAVYNPSNGLWSIVRSSDAGNTLLGWGGAPQDVPLN